MKFTLSYYVASLFVHYVNHITHCMLTLYLLIYRPRRDISCVRVIIVLVHYDVKSCSLTNKNIRLRSSNIDKIVPFISNPSQGSG